LPSVSDDETQGLRVLVEEPAVDDQVGLRFAPQHRDARHAALDTPGIQNGHVHDARVGPEHMGLDGGPFVRDDLPRPIP
jgi:hypothetical protein